MVGHLMGHHRHCRRQAQTPIGHKSGGNQNAIAKRMHAVAQQHRPTSAVGVVVVPRVMRCVGMCCVCMHMAMVCIVVVMAVHRIVGLNLVVFMSVVPQLGFVEQKEKHQPHQQDSKQGLGRHASRHRLLERLWQQTHKGCGKQSAGRQAQQMLGKPREQGISQQSSQPHTADASDQGTDQDRKQSHG